MFLSTKIIYVTKLLNPINRKFLIEQTCSKKHWNPKFKKERSEKVLKVTLPDYDEQRQNQNLSIEEIRSKLKEKGIAPSRNWNEKPMYVSCTGAVVDIYSPPKGDGKISLLPSTGIKKMADHVGKKGKSYMALRKIRNLDYEFDVPTVAEKVNEIYIEAQEALARNDEDRLHELVTEKAFPEMTENTKLKTIRWKYIQSLEPPRIIQIRTTDLVSKDNIFAQITVRLHSRQTLAIYDRFGRLMYGSEDVVKDVLEYVVFEKQLSVKHFGWRIHAKIIPEWAEPTENIPKTFYLPDVDKDFPEPPESKPAISSESKEALQGGEPQLAA